MNKYELLDKILRLFGGVCERKTEIPVIYYHSIVTGGGKSYGSTDLQVFKSHMQFLLDNNYQTLNFCEIPEYFKKKKNEKKVIITFDDGYKDNYDLIFDFMKKNKLKYNIFLIGSKIGSDNNYLSLNQIKEMAESKLVDFGAHTFNHVDCRKVDDLNVDLEVDKNNQILEKVIGHRVDDFCFPFGYYNRKAIRFFSDRTDYKHLYTSDYMKVTVERNTIIRGRAPIMNEDNISRFANKLKGKYNILYYIIYKRRAEWCHD